MSPYRIKLNLNTARRTRDARIARTAEYAGGTVAVVAWVAGLGAAVTTVVGLVVYVLVRARLRRGGHR